MMSTTRSAALVNAVAVPLEEAPEGYQSFDKGAASKYVLDPNGYPGTG